MATILAIHQPLFSKFDGDTTKVDHMTTKTMPAFESPTRTFVPTNHFKIYSLYPQLYD